MPSINQIMFTAGVTMLTMFALNFLAGVNPTARRFIHGNSVSVVGGSSAQGYTI